MPCAEQFIPDMGHKLPDNCMTFFDWLKVDDMIFGHHNEYR